jgi:hypothetical protein
VRLAINLHAGPFVGDDLDVRSMDMLVGVHEMRAENAGEELWRRDWVLLCLDVDGVLDGISGYNNAVVCSCVPFKSLAWGIWE